jgi:metallo-beta-lactamase family protein
MKLTFLGAAGTVTGSSYLLEVGKIKLLIDCGMFQGGRENREKNHEDCVISLLQHKCLSQTA